MHLYIRAREMIRENIKIRITRDLSDPDRLNKYQLRISFIFAIGFRLNETSGQEVELIIRSISKRYDS